MWIENCKEWALEFKKEIRALWLACQDSRTPWYAKILAVGVVAYALSPIDLIPDAIPVLGYLDDVILIPLGVVLVRKMIPQVVLRDCRQRASGTTQRPWLVRWIAAALVVVIWVALLALLAWWCIAV